MSRARVLIFADYYLPSLGAGGGVVLLANIVERFSDRFDFFVVARDHDSKTDRKPFEHIPLNEWTSCGPAQTYYFSRNRLTASVTQNILNFAKPDLVFLNSLFSIASVRFLWERRKGKYRDLPVIISPCGELQIEGLQHKSFKKRSFLTIANAAGLHDGVVWRASSVKEKEDIERAVGGSPKIFVVPDLVPKDLGTKNFVTKPIKRQGELKLSYVARIVPNKNLLFLLELLAQPLSGNVSLDIIGPHEHREYWSKCSRALTLLPQNVKATVHGLLPNSKTLSRLNDSHVFILPTETENFGYVVLEALAVGCPVIISDRTYWNHLAGFEFASVLGLEDGSAWCDAIDRFLRLDEKQFSTISNAAKDYADKFLSESDAEAGMEDIFAYAMKREGSVAAGY